MPFALFENHIVAVAHHPQRISDRRKGCNSRQIRDEWNLIGGFGEEGLYHICSAPSHLDICSTPGIVVSNGHKGWKPPRVRLYTAAGHFTFPPSHVLSAVFVTKP